MTRVLFLDYKSSVIAAVSLLLAMNLANESSKEPLKPTMKYWNENLVKYTGYTKSSLEPIFNEMIGLINLNCTTN